MRLSYRRVSYSYTPPTLEVTEQEIQNRVWQSGWACQTLAELGISGGTCAVGDRSGTKKTPHQEPATSHSLLVPTSPAQLQEINRVHQANLQRRLQLRLQAARERGDQELIQLLEAEARQLIRC